MSNVRLTPEQLTVWWYTLVSVGVSVCRRAEATDRISGHINAIEEESAKLREFAVGVVKWSEAYPLEVFPDFDSQVVHRILVEHGYSLDRVSAKAMRHLLTTIAQDAREALEEDA